MKGPTTAAHGVQFPQILGTNKKLGYLIYAKPLLRLQTYSSAVTQGALHITDVKFIVRIWELCRYISTVNSVRYKIV